MIRPPPSSPLFPYPTLSRPLTAVPPDRLSAQSDTVRVAALRVAQTRPDSARAMVRRLLASLSPQDSVYPGVLLDRKSTRLNSSHGYISYAVFCLKKKHQMPE